MLPRHHRQSVLLVRLPTHHSGAGLIDQVHDTLHAWTKLNSDATHWSSYRPAGISAIHPANASSAPAISKPSTLANARSKLSPRPKIRHWSTIGRPIESFSKYC